MSRGFPNLKALNAKLVKSWCGWLGETSLGCCHLEYADDDKHIYSVCVGWHGNGDDDHVIAWKIGRQSRRDIMQCDFDIDFEMPFDAATGDVDDTLHVIGKPTLRKVNETLTVLECPVVDYAEVSKEMKREAKRIAHKWLGRIEK